MSNAFICFFFVLLLISTIETCRATSPPTPATSWETNMLGGTISQSRLHRLAHYEKALGQANTFEQLDPRLAVTLHLIAAEYVWNNKYQEAEPLLKRFFAVAEDQRRQAESNPKYKESAEAVYRQWKSNLPIPDMSQNRAPIEDAIASAQDDYGFLLEQTDRLGEAEQCYKQALAIREKVLGQGNPLVGKNLSELANFLCKYKKYKEAEPLLKRALEILEKSPVPNDPVLVQGLEDRLRKPALLEAMDTYAQLLMQTGRERESADWVMRSKRLAQDKAIK